jgi:thiol-disulfide isomerase/thioredoxin
MVAGGLVSSLRNVAINTRLLAASLAVGALISAGGGYLISRSDGEDAATAAPDVVLAEPRTEQIPSIATNAAVEGTPLAAADLVTNEGLVVSTGDLVGQPLVINVWNSSCAPCKRELPAFAVVHADLGDRIRFVGVNNLDPPEVNQSFARERGVAYELLRDVDDGFASALGIATLPVTLFVAADGTIVRQTGVLEEQELREYAQELIG